MEISISSYSFQPLINRGEIQQADVVELAYRLGLRAVEFTELNGKTQEARLKYAAKIKDRADALGMSVTAYAIGADLYRTDGSADEIERVKQAAEVAKALGAPIMRHDVCYSLKEGRSFGLMLSQIAAATREVADYAQTLGVKTCVENHGYIAQDSLRMEALFNAVNHENFGLLIDMGNFVCVDEDSATAVSRLAPYAIYVHVKDMIVYDGNAKEGAFTRAGNRFAGTVIGEGCIPIEQNIRTLKLSGYDGVLSIEYEGAKDCIEGIRTGLQNLKSMPALA